MSSATQIGHVYWLGTPPESQSLNFDTGKLNHPALVLGAEREGRVQAVLITSLGGRTLTSRFPNDQRMRREYLPLNVAGAARHPDNDILISVIAAGRPPMLNRNCYVHLDPFDVEVRQLNLARRSTCLLPDDMMELLMSRLHELRPHFRAHRERRVTASTSNSARRQGPVPVTRSQQPLRQPVPSPTQQSALLPTQRTYSNYYGTTAASRHYHHEDLEWNTQPSPPPRPPYPGAPTGAGYGGLTEESGSSAGWVVLGCLGVAAAVFITTRYLFR
ncbi:hypothetical protein C7212DRAFT_285989 [Tuber magnatum]|uniref:Uncharacterized protein n=1 Tax=Tuber magnatum TaxID=42249 RepID=A0A317SFU0_9PEZI|nr:hypothetical protein C7212DRAFT_285989 [Tuber magnatum]